MPVQPTGTVTFLFTDIEGSTRLWDQQPRAMQAAVARHDVLLREAIEKNGGYVFKTVGDAFCAAFPTAPQAIEAALSAQCALSSAKWDGIGRIKVRMALHTGVAELRDNDYFGQPLNRVARLLSTGHGDQVLLSLATQQLVRDHLPKDTSLRDLGEGGLKDLSRAEHVYQVVAPDLPSEFPPLRSLDVGYIEPTTDAVEAHNPYKGLRAFQEVDTADFFGREILVERLLGRMAEEGPLCRFLAVVGPSGSGKSSVVRAGLVPAIRQGKLLGSQRWLIVEMLPGAHPLEELDAVLLSLAANPPDTLMSLLKEDERGLIRAVKRVLPRDESTELVLVIDQFEEVFTLVEDEPTRVHFLESLHAAIAESRSRLRVIVTLRADFFDRPLLYPDPGELMRQRTAVVLPLNAEELERAIVKPAQRVGVSLEPELLAAIVKDVGEQPGALPLLQYALTELFDKRAGRYMTLPAYNQSGGVTGALARRADELYHELGEQEQAAVRQLFLRLVTLGEGSEDTRRRVRRSELASISGSSQAMDKAIEVYGRYRLLTFDMDPVTKGPTVEVAHEAIIRTWGRLQEWLDQSRADLRIQRQLQAESTEWGRSNKDSSYLAGGARLAQFETLAEGAGKPGGVALTQEEREYLAASLEERDRQDRAEEERQARELQLERRAASRLRVMLVGAAVFLMIASALAVWAFNQGQAAQVNATRADYSAATAVANQNEATRNFQRSEAQRLAAEANVLIQSNGNSERIALLAVHSVNTQYTVQGDSALQAATTQDLPLRVFPVGHGEWVNRAVFSPDGKLIAAANNDKTARLVDVESGQELHVLEATAGKSVASVAFSPDGENLVTVGDDSSVRLWEVSTGKQLRTLSGHTGPVEDVKYSPDGKYILTSSDDRTARLWDALTGNEVQHFEHPSVVIEGAFSPDGKSVATGLWQFDPNSTDPPVRIWDVQTGALVKALPHGTGTFISSLAFSPDGRFLVSAGGDTKTVIIWLWDVQSGKEIKRFLGHTSIVRQVAFSRDGKFILSGSDDLTARVWDIATGQEVRRLTGHIGSILGVAYSFNGKYMLTASGDGTVRTWDALRQDGLPHFQTKASGLSPDGRYVLSRSEDVTSAQLVDANTGLVIREYKGSPGGVSSNIVVSPDGKQLLAGAVDGSVRIWDLSTGETLHVFKTTPGADASSTGSWISRVAYSPDSKYVAASNVDRTVWLWEATSGTEVFHVVHEASSTAQLMYVAYSPDGKYLASAVRNDETVKLWDGHTGKLIHTFAQSAYPVIFSQDGKYILTLPGRGTAQLWETETGKEVRTFTGHGDWIYDAAFSPDGNYLLTGSGDKTARLWEVATGREVRRFTDHTDVVSVVSFTPDGKYIFTDGDVDKTVRFWNLDYHDDVKYLCSRLQRDFTDEERTQYEIKGKEPTCPRP